MAEHVLEYNCDKHVDLYNDEASITGYGSVFFRDDDPGTQYEPVEGFVERVQPGAFAGIIARGDDVWAAVNHNMENILGRRGGGTLRLAEDDIGLRYWIDIPETTLGRDTRVQIKRGDFTGSSIGFVPAKDGVRVSKEGGLTVRTITEVARLRDVGPVHTPAFKGTTVSARSREWWQEVHDDAAFFDHMKKRMLEVQEQYTRARLREIEETLT